MPLEPPSVFPSLDQEAWDRFGAAMEKHARRLLGRFEANQPIPQPVGAQVQTRVLIRNIQAAFGMSEDAAAVAASLSVEQIRAMKNALGRVVADTPAYVVVASRNLDAQVPPNRLPPGSFTAPPTLSAAVTGATQSGIVAGATNLVDPLWREVAGIVQAYTVAGQGIDQTAAEIRRATGWNRWRSENVARTQMQTAYNTVTKGTYLSLGITQYEWCAESGPRTCAICRTLDGQIFETEVDMDPHPSCRCTMLPVLPPVRKGPRGYSTSMDRLVQTGQPNPAGGLRSGPGDYVTRLEPATPDDLVGLVPKSWEVPADPRMLVAWRKNQGWRPSAVLVKPGTAPPDLERWLVPR